MFSALCPFVEWYSNSDLALRVVSMRLFWQILCLYPCILYAIILCPCSLLRLVLSSFLFCYIFPRCTSQLMCSSMIALALGTLLCVLPTATELLYVLQVVATRRSRSLQCFLRGSSWLLLPALPALAAPGVASSTRPRAAVWTFMFLPTFLESAKEPLFFFSRDFLACPSSFLGRPSGFSRPDPQGFSRPDPRVFLARPSGLFGPALQFFSACPSGFLRLSLGVSSACPLGFPRHNSLYFWGFLGCCLAVGVPRFDFPPATRVSVVAPVLALLFTLFLPLLGHGSPTYYAPEFFKFYRLCTPVHKWFNFKMKKKHVKIGALFVK